MNNRELFFYRYGYYMANSIENQEGAFITFLDDNYDFLVANGLRHKIDEVIEDVWEDEYTLKDDINPDEVVEEIVSWIEDL